jgi:hypothetical protein
MDEVGSDNLFLPVRHLLTQRMERAGQHHSQALSRRIAHALVFSQTITGLPADRCRSCSNTSGARLHQLAHFNEYKPKTQARRHGPDLGWIAAHGQSLKKSAETHMTKNGRRLHRPGHHGHSHGHQPLSNQTLRCL